ncbi:MAG: DUF2920 family protein [Bacteroidales bacterium]
MPIIEQPVPDAELGIKRPPIQFDLRLPTTGLRSDTGLVFYIHGWGARYNDAYAGKLLGYLADKHNCVAVAVDYQGALATAISPVPAPNFFAKLAEHHGVRVTAPTGMSPLEIANAAIMEMGLQGVTQLHSDCLYILGPECYSNFGLLPALDHLQVMHHLLSELPLDKRRIYAIGTSYGGYIAMIAAKLAPNSFKLVVDNSGFSHGWETPAIFGVYGRGGVPKVTVCCTLAFSPEADSPNYLTEAMRCIRTIGVEQHYSGIDGVCASYSYHSPEDTVASPTLKIAASEVVSRYRRHNLYMVGEADIDGRTFKDMGHGMHASMRGLFDMTMDRWRGDYGDDAPPYTDFDLETVNVLPCGEKDYIVTCCEDGVSLCVVTGRQQA